MKKVTDIIFWMEANPIIALIENALIEWRTQQTRARKNVSLNSFADYLGVNRSLLSMWLSGERNVTHEYRSRIAKPIADLIGTDAYNILEVIPPNPYLQEINKLFSNLSPEHQRKLADDARRYETTNNAENTKAASKRRKTRTD